jgi:succinate dehydrogenase / fumarate reductase membrane anchor subunit
VCAWSRAGGGGDRNGVNAMSRKSIGLRTWLIQRLSAVYMLLFVVCFAIYFATNTPSSYLEWRTMMANSFVGITTTLFFLSLLTHAWVGMRDVIMDYVHFDGIRLALLTGVGFALLATAIWIMKILLTVSV